MGHLHLFSNIKWQYDYMIGLRPLYKIFAHFITRRKF